MNYLELLVIFDVILKFIIFIFFCIASYRHFKRDVNEPFGMQLIRITSLGLFLINMMLAVIHIFLNEQVSLIIVSLLLSIISIGLFSWSISTTKNKVLRLAYCDPSSEKLVVTGPYKYIRHPFYTAYILYWLSWLSLNNFSIIIVAFTFVIIIQYLLGIMTEEKYLSRKFNDNYCNYKSSTAMLIPWIL